MKNIDKRLNNIQKQMIIKQMKNKKDIILIDKEDGKNKVTINNKEYIVNNATMFIEDYKEKMKKIYSKYEPCIVDLDVPIYKTMQAMGINKERMTELLEDGDELSLVAEFLKKMKEYAYKRGASDE
jgi:hypothetical protein